MGDPDIMSEMFDAAWQNEPRDHTSDYDPDIPSLEDDYWQNQPIGDVFVVEWTDGTFSSKSAEWVSDTIDLADSDLGDCVKQILATDENGNLVPIRVGKQERVNDDYEGCRLLYFAHSKIYAGKRHVGTVGWTDH